MRIPSARNVTSVPALDLRKRSPALLEAPRDRAVVVDVPETSFLQISGHGGPSGPTFARALDALTDVAHTLRHGGPIEPVEALWWWGDPSGPLPPDEKDWMWTLMVRQPDAVTQADVRAIVEEMRERHGPVLSGLALARFHEGRCVQTMHVGPYATELGSLDRLNHAMRQMGFVPAGKHHEIYLDDPRDTPPDRLRTLLRRAVRWTDETSA